MTEYGFPRVITVSELTYRLKQLIERDPFMVNLWVRGEVSNLRLSPSGHFYFTLKDTQAGIRCVAFRSYRVEQPALTDGAEVIVRGAVGVWERDGVYQLYVREVFPAGTGAVYLSLERLKKKLAAEGLFHPSRKRRIPPFPRCIGIVTSPSGAVLRDMLSILGRRGFSVRVILVPVLVQGEGAPGDIARGIARLNRLKGVDLAIVARGGGSAEELFAFNTEEVARAIFASEIPIVSAVGHETDVTISDLVADLRAPTPSAAIEMVIPSRRELYDAVSSLAGRMERAAKRRIADLRNRVKVLASARVFRVPEEQLERYVEEVRELEKSLIFAFRKLIEKKVERVCCLDQKLEALNPYRVLERGYALCYDEVGSLVVRASQVQPGDVLVVQLSTGSLRCRVLERQGETG